MPDFSNLRKGAAAIAEAQEQAKANGGDFRPFTPSIFWSDPTRDKDNATRYVLFLNEMEDIPQVEMIGFIPVTVKGRDKPMYEQVIARTDPVIGESLDPMAEEWGAAPRDTNIAVCVELEPEFETVRGRLRPTGFTVATNDFERRIRDSKGELTDEKETVTAPVIGFVTQSPHNFFNHVSSTDASDGPIDRTALKIERLDDKNYKVNPYLDADIDLGPLIDYIDNISYFKDDERTALLEAVDAEEDDEIAAKLIGDFLLDKRLHELCDRERYDELLAGIDRPFKYGTKAKKEESKSSRPARERPSRGSQRRAKEEPEEAPADEPKEEPAAEEPAEEKPKRQRRSRAAAKPKEDTPGQEDPERISKLDQLRARAAAARADA